MYYIEEVWAHKRFGSQGLYLDSVNTVAEPGLFVYHVDHRNTSY